MLKKMPFGRVQGYIATLTEEQKNRTSVRSGGGLFDDWSVMTWTSREGMAKAVRDSERREGNKWCAVVRLATTEGYT